MKIKLKKISIIRGGVKLNWKAEHWNECEGVGFVHTSSFLASEPLELINRYIDQGYTLDELAWHGLIDPTNTESEK